MLVRPGLDEDAVFQKDVGCPQHVVALIDRISDMVETAARAGMIFRIGDVVALVVDGEPTAAEPAVVELNLLRDTAAQCFDHEVAYRADVSSQQVEMVEPPHADAAAVIALCDILERRSLGRRRLINTRIVVNLEDMSVGIVEAI